MTAGTGEVDGRGGDRGGGGESGEADAPWLADRLPSTRTLAAVAVAVNVELAALFAYTVLTGTAVTRLTLYGLVWLNVAGVVLWRTRVAPASDRTRRRAAVVAAGYLVVLAVAGGVVTLGGTGSGLRVAPLPFGFGPALIYGGAAANLVLMPARVAGYVALAYLVYATVVDAAGAAVPGILGLLSCVSCTWPVIAGLVTGVAGGGSAVLAAAAGWSYDLSTAVFLVTVCLLYWRPLVGDG
jgi:hypothetical protein